MRHEWDFIGQKYDNLNGVIDQPVLMQSPYGPGQIVLGFWSVAPQMLLPQTGAPFAGHVLPVGNNAFGDHRSLWPTC